MTSENVADHAFAPAARQGFVDIVERGRLPAGLLRLVAVVDACVSAGAILFLLGATHFIGLYASLVLFLLFYLKFVGRHTWLLTIILTIGIPVFIFCLFEWALTISLPKGISEPLFYPIYDLIY